MMECTNAYTAAKEVPKDLFLTFLKLLSPFAPHLPKRSTPFLKKENSSANKGGPSLMNLSSSNPKFSSSSKLMESSVLGFKFRLTSQKKTRKKQPSQTRMSQLTPMENRAEGHRGPWETRQYCRKLRRTVGLRALSRARVIKISLLILKL
jgi:hypothetical protein